jgi:hypothetical protein
MNLLNEIQKSSRDNSLISSDANQRANFSDRKLLLDIVSNRVSSHPTVSVQFFYTPKRIRSGDHSAVVEGAYSDEE